MWLCENIGKLNFLLHLCTIYLTKFTKTFLVFKNFFYSNLFTSMYGKAEYLNIASFFPCINAKSHVLIDLKVKFYSHFFYPLHLHKAIHCFTSWDSRQIFTISSRFPSIHKALKDFLNYKFKWISNPFDQKKKRDTKHNWIKEFLKKFIVL